MSLIYSSIACNLDHQILTASLPLFEDEKIEAIEWSFDTLFKLSEIPEWFADLVEAFGEQNRLIGHGVYFSIFSGKWLPEQQIWLDKLRKICKQFHFDHITEHFGFLTGEDFHKGAPISVPFTRSTLAIGIDRLQRIQEACNCPVGLENLAFSYSLDEVKRHGEFLNQLADGVNGFIILDLHNLYCQSHNFDLPFEEIIQLYPLQKVREIHISGGSWDDKSVEYGKKVRRDTHDFSVPQEVFDYLKSALNICPNLKYVVLEQLGTALDSADQQEAFRSDFLTMDRIIKKNTASFPVWTQNHFLPEQRIIPASLPREDLLLFDQQRQLSHILETASGVSNAKKMLGSSLLAGSEWSVEDWEPYMLETALAIAQKWKNGFD